MGAWQQRSNVRPGATERELMGAVFVVPQREASADRDDRSNDTED
jgi:hypothetical protein